SVCGKAIPEPNGQSQRRACKALRNDQRLDATCLPDPTTGGCNKLSIWVFVASPLSSSERGRGHRFGAGPLQVIEGEPLPEKVGTPIPALETGQTVRWRGRRWRVIAEAQGGLIQLVGIE